MNNFMALVFSMSFLAAILAPAPTTSSSSLASSQSTTTSSSRKNMSPMIVFTMLALIMNEWFQKVFDVVAQLALSCRAAIDHDAISTFIDAEHASDSDVAVARCADNLQRVLEPMRGLPWCLGLGWHGDRINFGVQRADCNRVTLCSAS
ncbi:unnamed protein product [Sphagnum balticum]